MAEVGRRAAMPHDAATDLADFTTLYVCENSDGGGTPANRGISSLAAPPVSSVSPVLGLAAAQRHNVYAWTSGPRIL